MEQHFVTFYSPGTFFAETTTKPIESWDVNKALEMSHEVLERYNARPYAFQFTTRGRADDELDSHVIAESPRYHLGGQIKTLAEVEAENNPDDHILLSNMRGNGFKRIIVNGNSWKSVQPLEDDDIVLDYTPVAT